MQQNAEPAGIARLCPHADFGVYAPIGNIGTNQGARGTEPKSGRQSPAITPRSCALARDNPNSTRPTLSFSRLAIDSAVSPWR
jgi:hypothetical protein